MIKNLILGIFCFSSFFPLMAQHCAFDNVSITVLEIRSSESGKHIPRLKISLLHENLEAVMIDFWEANEWHTKPFLFWENQDSLQHDKQPANEPYWFADSNYVQVSSRVMNGHYILVEDPSGQYETLVYPLGTFEAFKLCSAQSNCQHHNRIRPLENFSTVKITLNKCLLD
jgi:hypothetical protein